MPSWPLKPWRSFCPGAQELDGPGLEEGAGLDRPIDLVQADEIPVVLGIAAADEAGRRAEAEPRGLVEGDADAVVGRLEALRLADPAPVEGRIAEHDGVVGAGKARPRLHVAGDRDDVAGRSRRSGGRRHPPRPEIGRDGRGRQKGQESGDGESGTERHRSRESSKASTHAGRTVPEQVKLIRVFLQATARSPVTFLGECCIPAKLIWAAPLRLKAGCSIRRPRC